MTHRILVVDDEESIRVTLEEALADEATTVRTAPSGIEAMRVLSSDTVDLVLLDQKLKESGEDGIEVLREIRGHHPSVVTIIMTAFGRIESAVEAIKLGAYNYIQKPLDVHQLKRMIEMALDSSRLERENEAYRRQHQRAFSTRELFGPSRKTHDLLEQVHKAADSATSTVLIRGETGVGKELIARQIHESSPVSDGPFVDFNCSALPENLVESELFGYEKGAFTDAKGSKRGLFELADRGSLFLDEIGEMPLPMQAKLLRVLESKSFRKLGSTIDVHVHVRVIAATNKDLFGEVEAGRFREDLYYRLDVVPIFVPPLRERREDIPILACHFLERFNGELTRSVRGISEKAMEMLASYNWPGNVRELRNLMERLVLMTQAVEVLPEHLPTHLSERAGIPRVGRVGVACTFPQDDLLTLAEIEHAAIEHTLACLDGNKTKAAEVLGISRQTLRTKLRSGSLSEP